MLDNKGFTLVELLAVIAMLGIFMMVTIPNIMGISEANKKQAYADDALKFKNTVEYMIRSDENYIKPENVGDCVVVSLTHLLADDNDSYAKDDLTPLELASGNYVSLEGSEYEDAPYGGKYLLNYSYVVVKNEGQQLKYYVQLIEKYDSTRAGVKLVESSLLEGSNYVDSIESPLTGAPAGEIKSKSQATTALSGISCNVVKGYYINGSF